MSETDEERIAGIHRIAMCLTSLCLIFAGVVLALTVGGWSGILVYSCFAAAGVGVIVLWSEVMCRHRVPAKTIDWSGIERKLLEEWLSGIGPHVIRKKTLRELGFGTTDWKSEHKLDKMVVYRVDFFRESDAVAFKMALDGNAFHRHREF